MGFFVWMNLKGRDLAAFLVSGILGYLARGRVVCLHVDSCLLSPLPRLACDRRRSRSGHIVANRFLDHHAHGLSRSHRSLRNGTPLYSIFSILRYGIVGMAIFERNWLFTGGRRKETPDSAPITAIVAEATAEDHGEWLRYIALQRRPFPKPGTTLQAEYERWLIARAKDRSTAS